jgi:hypothetical protein
MDSQRGEMLEYIRKQNWAYKEEELTQGERTAWLRTLGFFTGLPPEKFTHIIDKFYFFPCLLDEPMIFQPIKASARIFSNPGRGYQPK